jgi:molecular chaperone DnaK (HSP70)
VGIDLGTTFSAVAAHHRIEEEPVIIEDRHAEAGRTTPSVVAFDPTRNQMFVGIEAKRQIAYEPENTIIEIKREMGEVFREDTLDKFRARGVYRAKEEGENGYGGDPVVVKFRDCDQSFTPQEISAFVLMKMKLIAEEEIGAPIRDAVITVPAYFTAKQKKATEEAALLAGLYPRQLIPEPTAAAICYGLDRFQPVRRAYLVYDLGGGTFDVSIITVEQNDIDVVATSGDPRLGGADFDDRITAWAIDELKKEPHQLDVSGDAKAKAIIRCAAEDTKKALSDFPSATLDLMELRPASPIKLTLTREKFEELIDGLLDKSLTFVNTAIELAGKKDIRKDDLEAILLVGGSSKIPRVRAKLLEYLQRDEDFVRSGINADEAIARGAAQMALHFQPSPAPFDIDNQPDGSLVTLDGAEDQLGVSLITEHSLGVRVQRNLVDRIIECGTNIPVSVTKGGYANAGPSSELDVQVYQGEDAYAYNNELVGTVHLGPMEPKPAGHHQFELTYALDVNGTLAVSVHHVNEQKRYNERFEQPGTIGAAGLSHMRQKLLRLLPEAVRAAGEPAPQPAAPTATPPSPTPPDLTPAAPEPAAPSPAGPPGVEPPAEPAATAPTDVLEPAVEVPDQFKGSVRRARKLLLKKPHPKLIEALNTFISSLNQGATEDELADLGDDLEDTYIDCRHETP